MARSRNIKPGFFLNEQLVELPYGDRLLFIGLWCIADREGRLENRPKKIKMQVFPADSLDISEALLRLSEAELITLYTVDSKEYIQIDNFTKHQNPHHREAESIIPAPDEPRASLGKAVLIPDSLNPITDTSEGDNKKEKPEKKIIDFDEFWNVYPRHEDKIKAKAKWAKLKYSDQVKALEDCKTRYISTEKQFIPLPTTYINGARWEDDPIENKNSESPKKSLSSYMDNLL